MDCWRFYDDGLPALAKWADLDVLDVLDAQVQWRPVHGKGDMWRDAAIVLQRPVRDAARAQEADAKVAMVKAAHLGLDFAITPGPASLPATSPLALCKATPMMRTEEERLFAANSGLSHETRQVGRNLRATRKLLSQPAKDIR